MNEVLFHYEKIDPTTWVYLASLLIVGLFFKFGRFWSVRNLDLILLILLAPGLLLVFNGREIQQQTRQPANRHSRDVRTPDAAPAVAEISQGNVGIDGKTDASREPSGNERNDPATSGQNVAENAPPSSSENATKGEAIERIGFIWLLMAGALLLVRLLIDPTMVRRPLLEPNLTTGGLTFSCCSLFVFLMANVIASQPTPDDLRGPRSAEQLMARRTSDDLERHGPGYALVFMLPSLPTVADSPHVSPLPGADLHERMGRWQVRPDARKPAVTIVAEYLDVSDDDTVRLRRRDGTELTVPWEDLSDPDRAFVRKIKAYTAIAKLVAILSQLAIVAGVIAVGYWHFNNVKMGVGAATLYLMLPYTSQMTGRVDHTLPAAFLVWAVLCYRRPLISGIFVGFAVGVVYYPLFLLPLWVGFYWQRGLLRFAIGVVSMLLLMVLTLAFVSPDLTSFWHCFKGMFGLRLPDMDGLKGIWHFAWGWPPVYRYPILTAFVALSGSLVIWPAEKNLGTLISCSAAVMVATQFWHGYEGGLCMAWYLPLFLLTMFRPNLEDRVAVNVVDEGWTWTARDRN